MLRASDMRESDRRKSRFPGWRPFLALVALLMLASAAPASYLPKGAQTAAGTQNIVLIYNSAGHRNWQQADFIPLLTHINVIGQPSAVMFDTLLVLMLQAPSGHAFCPGFGDVPVNKTDCEQYLYNRLFGGDSHLPHLEAAAAQAAAALGRPDLRWKVILTIPYPGPAQHDFGAVSAGGPSLDLAKPDQRLAAVQWYMSTALQLWSAASFRHLDLVGWYWVNEEVSGTADTAFVPRVAQSVHSQGRRFFWIPWYKAPGSATWSAWGFDAVIHQPNYFFTLSVPLSRLADASAYARDHGMGIELELDDRAIQDPAYRSRYYDYLHAGDTEGFRTGALTAWYMGADTLVKCAASTDRTTRGIYEDTYTFITGRDVPGDANRNRTLDMQDAADLLRMASGLTRTYSGNFASQLDVAPDGRVDLRDALWVLRRVCGTDPDLP